MHTTRTVRVVRIGPCADADDPGVRVVVAGGLGVGARGQQITRGDDGTRAEIGGGGVAEIGVAVRHAGADDATAARLAARSGRVVGRRGHDKVVAGGDPRARAHERGHGVRARRRGFRARDAQRTAAR